MDKTQRSQPIGPAVSSDREPGVRRSRARGARSHFLVACLAGLAVERHELAHAGGGGEVVGVHRPPEQGQDLVAPGGAASGVCEGATPSQDILVLAPGNAFSLTGAASQFMRFNVAQCGDDSIFASLERALR
mgnify:CR=1 FL=1